MFHDFPQRVQNRVGPNYKKLTDKALLWSKVVPWYKEQYETLITQLT